MPLQQHRDQAHVGHRFVAARVGSLNQGPIIGQHEIGFIHARHAVFARLVADIHVEHGAGDIAPARGPHLPGARSKAASRPVGVTRIAATQTATPVVGIGRLFGACRAAVEGLVGTRTVVAGVRDEQVMRIRIGVIGRAIGGKSVGFRPTVLTVIQVIAAALLEVACVSVDGDHVAGQVGVLISNLEDIPGICSGGRVRIAGVVVDDVMQGGPQRGGIAGIGRAVVARRYLGAGHIGERHRHHNDDAEPQKEHGEWFCPLCSHFPLAHFVLTARHFAYIHPTFPLQNHMCPHDGPANIQGRFLR